MEKLKIGVFGAWRGQSLMKSASAIEECEVVAILDKDPQKIEEARQFCKPDVKICTDFDDLLSSGIDVVFLCNYFHEHAKYAIQAMKKGIHVFSECLPAVTMKECVELVEAVEQTGCYYAMAENCPFTPSVMEMTRLYQQGVLGNVIYAEAEYSHPSAPADANKYRPYPNHWRSFLPKTYYLTHSIGPLMVMTDLMPKKVIGKVAPGQEYARSHGKKNGDSAGVMLVEMDGGVLFRVTGCNTYGPASHWFRLACDKGGVENVRYTEDTVSLCINPWDVPESMKPMGNKTTYIPTDNELSKTARKYGSHAGADFWTVYNFVQDLVHDRQPYMDVYRSAAIAAVGILGWRSVLNDSKQYEIPNFRDPAAREAYRNDDLSPWRGEIPYMIYSAEE